MSHAMSDYDDLMQRSCALLRHVLPSVVMPALITALDLSETRGSRVFAEVQASLAEVAVP